MPVCHLITSLGGLGKINFTGDLLTGLDAGDNNLSFIETSALDASNVELAFQIILTGTEHIFLLMKVNLLSFL